MKLICSILILAGVFALNNASISYEDQMRLIKDQQKLEDLKRMTATNRDVNSIQCSQDMMSKLTVVMAKFNNAMSTCNDTKEAEIKRVEGIAMDKIENYSAAGQELCEALNNCALMPAPGDALNCYQGKSSEGSSVLSGMSADAATQKVELQKGVENAIGKQEVCERVAMQEYKADSNQIDKDFEDCVNGKTTVAGETTTTTTTPVPQPEETTQAVEEPTTAEEGGEVQPEGRIRRSNGANKYRRF